jgi:hypothetical protein
MNISIPTMSFKTITLPKFSLPKLFKKNDTNARIARLELQLKQMQNLVYSQEILRGQK